MNRSKNLVFATALLAISAASAAFALERNDYSAEILVDGRPLVEYASRGKTYVEARKGAEYEIRFTNRTGGRVGVAIAVDGLNSIDAKETSARDAAKWIVGPWETITIGGWQTSSGTARRFYFTDEPSSYGAWMGKTRNLGLVSVAVFREKLPDPPRRHWWSGLSGGRRDQAQPSEAPAAPMPSAEGSARGAEPQQKAAADTRQKKESLDDESAATGIGREVDHEVTRVAFDAESHPATVLDLRYEYHEGLARLGVLPRPRPRDPLDRRESARGYSDSWAPDPYRQ